MYVVATPVSVLVGLNVPQAPALPQVTVQLTPAGSLVTAVTGVWAVVLSVVGGVGLRVTVITAALVIVIMAWANLVGSVLEVAVTVTVFPVGTAAGAV